MASGWAVSGSKLITYHSNLSAILSGPQNKSYSFGHYAPLHSIPFCRRRRRKRVPISFKNKNKKQHKKEKKHLDFALA